MLISTTLILALIGSSPIGQASTTADTVRIATFDDLVASMARSNVPHEVEAQEQMMRVATRIGETRGWLEIYWKPGVIQLRQPLGFKVPPDRLAEVEHAIMRINHAMLIPGMFLNHENNVPYCQHVVLSRQEEGGIPEQTLQIMFSQCRKNAEILGRGIRGVAEGRISAADILEQSTEPQSVTDAREMLAAFAVPGADVAEMSKRFRPRPEDYARVFKPGFVAAAQKLYEPLWDAGNIIVTPKEGQTEVEVIHVTTEELINGTGKAASFPGGYSKVIEHLQPGVVFHRLKFKKPGDTSGFGFDGLVRIDDRWILVPKPWLALE